MTRVYADFSSREELVTSPSSPPPDRLFGACPMPWIGNRALPRSAEGFYGVLGTSPVRASGRGRICTAGAVAVLSVRSLSPTLGEVTTLSMTRVRANVGATLNEYACTPPATSPILQETTVGTTWLQLGLEAATRLTGLEKVTSQTAAV